MSRRDVAEVERHLTGGLPTSDRFTGDELSGLPEPVARYFRAAIAPGAPLATAAKLRMDGRLKLNGRWLPFRARETLAPRRGFIWRARVAGVITGSDSYAGQHGALAWRLLGLLPVVGETGTDVSRSAAGRAGGESVWLPTALLPRCSVEWTAVDATHVTARLLVEDVQTVLRLRLAPTGRLEAVTFDRWGDPDNTGTAGLHPMGMEATATATFSGLTIPAEGKAGWFHGTPRWDEGEFFRWRITHLRPIPEV